MNFSCARLVTALTSTKITGGLQGSGEILLVRVSDYVKKLNFSSMTRDQLPGTTTLLAVPSQQYRTGQLVFDYGNALPGKVFQQFKKCSTVMLNVCHCERNSAGITFFVCYGVIHIGATFQTPSTSYLTHFCTSQITKTFV